MKNKTLYLECYSGISGDMTVSALLDLGADQNVLRKGLESLQVDGYRIEIGRRKKCGIDGCAFHVILDADEHDHHHEHEHDHEHEHHHEYHHDHDHHHEHGHDHDHHHGHPHVHRNIHDIYEIIDRLDSSERVKALSRRMFDIVAEAEAKAHGIPLEQVHFHEVGAIDSIIDIISTAICIDNLGITETVVSPLYEGTGHVHCQHGTIPVPVPAVSNITASFQLPLKITDTVGEMVTPTGAAIAAALRTHKKLPENYVIHRIGIGTGTRDYGKANILRAMLIEEVKEEKEKLCILETNIDDCSGEAFGYTMDKLMEAGAKDVWYTPIYMKKNRPAYLLSVLCDGAEADKLEAIIFKYTTSIGIRRHSVERRALPREIVTVNTEFGDAEVKVVMKDGVPVLYPEYESVKGICDQSDMTFHGAYALILKKALEQAGEE